MMKHVKSNKLYTAWIVADLQRKILFIPKIVKDNSKNLSRGEATLYLTYKNCYPDFSEAIV